VWVANHTATAPNAATIHPPCARRLKRHQRHLNAVEKEQLRLGSQNIINDFFTRTLPDDRLYAMYVKQSPEQAREYTSPDCDAILLLTRRNSTTSNVMRAAVAIDVKNRYNARQTQEHLFNNAVRSRAALPSMVSCLQKTPSAKDFQVQVEVMSFACRAQVAKRESLSSDLERVINGQSLPAPPAVKNKYPVYASTDVLKGLNFLKDDWDGFEGRSR